jgi:hypothetical protein
MQAGIDAEQHARRVRRFGEAVYVVAESQLQAKRHAARAAADAARQIDKQRMIGIDHASLAGKLRFQALAGDGIAEEQRARVFIIDKEAVRVRFGGFAPLFDRHAVILFVFNHRHAVAAQFGFFHARASADICTVTLKPMRALMMPIDIPRLPVEPTAMLYWLKNCLNSGVSSLR